MNIPYTDSIFLGIVRLLLWILFLFVIKRLVFQGKRSQNQVKTMGNIWAFYGSIVMVVVFLLTQINSYDQLTCLLLITLFFILRFIGIRNLTLNTKLIRRKKKILLLKVIENVEDEDAIIDINKEPRRKRFNIKPEILIAVGGAVLAMLVRFYLMQFDNYQLSSSWFQELTILKGISDQTWFNNDLMMSGEYAMMSLYSMLTGISPEMALESFGLFQAFILCFIIFWFIDAMTNSLITIPLISALAFALLFNLAPINITQLTHSKGTLMALTFALPAMMFIRKPWKLYQSQPKAYFFGMLMIFMAIALTNLFTLLILIPPYFVVSAIFLRKRYVVYFVKSLGAYVLASSIIFGSFALSAYQADVDFFLFIRSNLLAITATTNTSNMVFSYDKLILVIQIISAGTIAIMLLLFKTKSVKWAGPISFLIYMNVMLLISESGFEYFDNDLFNEVLPVFIACAIGLIFYLIYYFFNTSLKRIVIPDFISAPIIFIAFVGFAYFSQQELLIRNIKTGSLSKDILEAYQEVKANYIPYSYAVINSNSLQAVSVNSHNFISYAEFVDSYPERDSVYFANKENKDFLRANSEYIVPNSLLIFMYDQIPQEFSGKVAIDANLMTASQQQLDRLKALGRPVRLFFEKGGLKVYEIVNNPNLAKVSESL